MKHCCLLGVFAGLLIVSSAVAEEPEPRHGLSAFGDLRYGPDFEHYEYANPDAPKGGEISTYGASSTFDSLNPFILRGIPASGIGLTFDALMEGSQDEPASMYGLVAESVEAPHDLRWIVFNLREEARFHDGSPIRASDVEFTYNVLVTEGHPIYRILLRDVEGVEVQGPLRVRFSFADVEGLRDLALTVAGLPVLSATFFENNEFNRTTLEPILGSGPYRLSRLDTGRNIVFERVEDYWGRDLPVNRGRYNFDRIRFEYFRDRVIALEAFKAGEYDLREEFTARSWATEYDIASVRDGRIILETLPDNTPSGVQGFFINTRREKFQDRRVREALATAFDFEWANRVIFHGMYTRMNSMFENSELAATGSPGEAELALLEPWRAQLPEEVFGPMFESPVSDGTGNNRTQLREASRLLTEAGWTVVDGQRVNAAGEPLVVEFVDYQPTFERVIEPFVQSLELLGIQANFRLVDANSYQNRLDSYDFDVTPLRFVQSLTPGVEQRNYWSSAFADVQGGRNMSGIRSPVVDALVEEIVAADSREALLTATRALDRVLMWGYYVVPNWYKGVHNIAYWNRYARPEIAPRYARGILDLWWEDPEMAARLQSPGAPLE